METLEKKKTAGRPAKSGVSEPEFDAGKEYIFELLDKYNDVQPRDKVKNSELMSGFRPVYTFPNSGLAWDEETEKVRAWRLIMGQPSIWVDEQTGLEKMEPKDVNRMLAQAENEITFINGRLRVRGVEELKLKALHAMDTFDGKEKQYKNKPKLFKLINPDVELKMKLDGQYEEFFAMQKVKEASEDEMLAVALALGISIEDQSEQGIRNVRSAMFDKAKASPKDITKIFNHPRHKIKFTIFQAFKKNIISDSLQNGMICWVEGKVPVFELNGNSQYDAQTQLLDKIIQKQKAAIDFYKAIEERLELN